MSSAVLDMNMMGEMEEPIQSQTELADQMDPEMLKMQNMTEEEALKYLGLEKQEVFVGLDHILGRRNSWAMRIVNYLMEKYPEQMPLMMNNGKLEKLLDQRIELAKMMYDTMQKKLQEKQDVQNLSFLERVLAEQRIREQIMEVISREILYKPLEI